MDPDVAAAFSAIPVLPDGHRPEWVHAQDHGAMALHCSAVECQWPKQPRITYRIATDAVKNNGAAQLLAPHLADFVEWHSERRGGEHAP